MSTAKARGRSTFLCGNGLSLNPYSYPSKPWRLWRAGWFRAADLDYRRIMSEIKDEQERHC